MKLRIRRILKKVIRLLERRLALVILVIFVITMLYAAFVFYNFAYKAVTTSPEASFEKVEIKKAVFERVTKRLESRGKNILEAMRKEYSDVFR